MTTLLAWAAANPTYAVLLGVAALWLLIGWAMDEHERAQGMDAEPDPFQELTECEVIAQRIHAQRIHAQMVRDGLIRGPNAHERLGDA